MHSSPIKITENKALNSATVNGVVPPLKVIGPSATASPKPIEHRIAQQTPTNLLDFLIVSHAKSTKKCVLCNLILSAKLEK
jgi:hypothetical protein